MCSSTLDMSLFPDPTVDPTPAPRPGECVSYVSFEWLLFVFPVGITDYALWISLVSPIGEFEHAEFRSYPTNNCTAV